MRYHFGFLGLEYNPQSSRSVVSVAAITNSALSTNTAARVRIQQFNNDNQAVFSFSSYKVPFVPRAPVNGPVLSPLQTARSNCCLLSLITLIAVWWSRELRRRKETCHYLSLRLDIKRTSLRAMIPRKASQFQNITSIVQECNFQTSLSDVVKSSSCRINCYDGSNARISK